MALDMTPEQKAIGKANFHRVVGKLAEATAQGGMTRRAFMQGLLAAGAAVPHLGGGVLRLQQQRLSATSPSRPASSAPATRAASSSASTTRSTSSSSPSATSAPPTRSASSTASRRPGVRKGFNHHYGSRRQQAASAVYDDYRELLDDPDIEVVVIALPLHLHAPVAIEAMKAGKHVLCEKLMAWNITQCKEMIRAADDTGQLLSIGHQRHYSMLYAHAVEVSTPASSATSATSAPSGTATTPAAPRRRTAANRSIRETGQTKYRDSWRPAIHDEDRSALESTHPQQYGYKSMDELVRWRLYKRTGGGLMAELGSHQLDACSIFLGKVQPLAVTAVGGKHFYQDDREVEDHVFCTFEFPGKNYAASRAPRRRRHREYNDIVVVTYSSISTNGFEPYGECVMGSQGTMIIETEQNVYLWGGAGRSTAVTATTGGSGPRLDASASTRRRGERRAADTGQDRLGAAPVSRGYREEMEHLAYCIRMRDQGTEARPRTLKPRCDGRAAMADAIIALTANQAMKHQRRIVFDDRWYRPESTDVPDPDMHPKRFPERRLRFALAPRSARTLPRKRKQHPKRRPLQRLRLDLQLRLVVLQDDRHERQAQPHAGADAGEQGVVALGREVRLGAAAAHFLGHADAVVLHFQDGSVPVAAGCGA